MTQVLLCAHKWSVVGESFDEDGEFDTMICSWCKVYSTEREPEPRVVLGRIENE